MLSSLALALAAALPVVLLPPGAKEVPAEAIRAASEALWRGLPLPFAPAPLDPALVAAHLDAAGPACRQDGLCLCSAIPLPPAALVMDLSLSRTETGLWSADLRLLAPCEEEALGRRAELLLPDKEALARWVREAARHLLRGRDLGPLRHSGDRSISARPAEQR